LFRDIRFHNLSQLMFLSSLPSLIGGEWTPSLIGGEWTHESNRQILVFSLFQRFILKGVCVKMKYKRNFWLRWPNWIPLLPLLGRELQI
jgi:hypothetical protein